MKAALAEEFPELETGPAINEQEGNNIKKIIYHEYYILIKFY